MPKLYEIADGFMDLLEKQDELTPEEVQEIAEELQTALKEKSANIIGYYQTQNALLAAVDDEIKRLQEYKKIISNRLTRYKNYVADNMKTIGIKKIETPVGKISLAKSPPSVVVTDDEKVPAEYKETVVTIKPNKKKILENFKATGEIPAGVEIQADNKSLRIK